MSEFKNAIVLVKGAGRGLGRDLAVGFSRRGALIAATGISPLHLEETAKTIRDNGGRCLSFDHEMSKKHFIQGTFEEIESELGTPDMLINAQYLNPKGALETIAGWDWQHTLDANLTGTMYTIQSFLRIAGNSPSHKSIITLIPATSHAALEIINYALLGLTAVAAREGAHKRVNVNAVSQKQRSSAEVCQEIYRYCAEPGNFSGNLLTSQGPIPLEDLPL